MSPAALQPRPATGLIDASISIIRRRYWDLFLAHLVFAAPFLVVAVFVSSASIRYVNWAMLLVLPLAAGATAHLVSQEFTGSQVSLGAALGRAVRRGPGLIGVALIVGVGVLLGAIGLIIGAFVVAARLYTALPVYALEDVDAGVAIDRSMALARGNVLHVLDVLIPAWLAPAFCGAIVGSLIVVGRYALLGHILIPLRVQTLCTMVAALACRPLRDVPVAVMYYDLRIRREGLDIETMVASLRNAAVSPPDQPPLSNAPGANPA